MNPQKRAYSTPKLQTYGNIQSLTSNVGNMGMADGGAGATSKTTG